MAGAAALRFGSDCGREPDHPDAGSNFLSAGRLGGSANLLLSINRHPEGLWSSLTCDKLQATLAQVTIRSFAHKGLERLYADDDTKGVPPDTVDKLRKMLAFLEEMEDPEELRALPSWKAHTLIGDRSGTWSLSVTGNRRLTFRIEPAEREICDVNLEDYH